MEAFKFFLLTIFFILSSSLFGATPIPAITSITSGPYYLSANGTLTLKVSASCSTYMKYQWQKNGVNIARATSDVFQIPSLLASHSGDYSVTISATGGQTKSQVIQLVVESGTSEKLSLVSLSKPSQQVIIGNIVKLNAGFTGDGPVTYSWYKNGALIPGQVSYSYSINDVKYSDLGNYTVHAATPYSSMISPTMTVIPSEYPFITKYPNPRIVGQVGSSLNLELIGENTNPDIAIKYSWTKNGSTLSGGNVQNLNFPTLSSSHAGTYRARLISNTLSTIGSDIKVIVLPANAPGIVNVDGKYTYNQGEAINLQARTLPASNVIYTWRKNGSVVGSSSSLSISSASVIHSGLYTLTTSNSAGSDSFNFNIQVLPSATAHLTNNELALIINTNDPYSVAIGDYYKNARQIPDANIFRVNIPVRDMNRTEFNTFKTALLARIPAHIQAFAVAWKYPHRVECNSFTSALSRGFDPYPCTPNGTAYPSCSFGTQGYNPMYNSASNSPFTSHGLRPSMLLAAYTVDQAKAMIDRGVASDGTRPLASAYVLKTSDNLRSLRGNLFSVDQSIPYGFKDSSSIKNQFLISDVLSNKSDVMFYFTGRQTVYNLSTNTFLPGAVADHLTSFGGGFSGSGQMSILKFIENGATGSFGTVSEPCAYKEKFPDPRIMVQRYGHGDTLIESYWKSVRITFQGNFIGEPLAAPYK